MRTYREFIQDTMRDPQEATEYLCFLDAYEQDGKWKRLPFALLWSGGSALEVFLESASEKPR